MANARVSSNYNALYVEATKRLTHGLDLHASFTFAKVMDTLSFTNAEDLTPAHLRPAAEPHV